jgi:hypothetical protein
MWAAIWTAAAPIHVLGKSVDVNLQDGLANVYDYTTATLLQNWGSREKSTGSIEGIQASGRWNGSRFHHATWMTK